MTELLEQRLSSGISGYAKEVFSLRTLLAAAMLYAFVLLPDAAAATIAVATERHGDAIDIHASADLKADPQTAWRVLTDYEHYPNFIPDLRLSHVVARIDGKITVEQSGSAALWLFKIPLDVTFEIIESPPYRVQSRGVAGGLKSIASNYTLTPAPFGTRLDYVGRVVPGFEFFEDFEEAAVKQNITRQFQALADEIEHRSDATVGGASAAAR
jgi:hypothetical protein